MEEKVKKKSKFMKLIQKMPKTIKYILIILIVAVAFVVGIMASPLIKTDETVIDFEFKNVGQLVTQEWYGRIVEDSSKDRKIFNSIAIPFTESRLIFSLDVEVLAGVDFEKIEYDISEASKKVTITLPHSEVYKSYEVKDSFKAYLDEESWFTNINATEQQQIKDKIVETGKEEALASGLLEKADENAKNIIINMVKGNNATKDYEVEFKYSETE